MFRIPALLPIVALLAACQSIVVKKPVGSEPAQVAAAQWAGSWYNPDGALTVRVVDEAAGKMEVAIVGEEDGAFKMEQWDLELRKEGDLLLLNVRTEEARAKGVWNWCRVDNRDGKTMVVWSPRFEAFKALVDEGKLATDGASTKDELVLDEMPAEVLAEIARGDAKWWEWDKPIVLFRLAGE